MAKRKGPRIDKELEEFRSLMEPPDTFEDGFSWAALLGAIFVALLMVPGSIYMTLLAGVAVRPRRPVGDADPVHRGRPPRQQGA